MRLKPAFLSSPEGFVSADASHEARASMRRDEHLQAVYKSLSSRFIKSSYVVIWYIVLFHQKNTDRPSGVTSRRSMEVQAAERLAWPPLCRQRYSRVRMMR